MKEFQIEVVVHNYISTLVHVCCLVDYYPPMDILLQLNYSSIEFALTEKTNNTVGIWRVKPTDK